MAFVRRTFFWDLFSRFAESYHSFILATQYIASDGVEYVLTFDEDEVQQIVDLTSQRVQRISRACEHLALISNDMEAIATQYSKCGSEKCRTESAQLMLQSAQPLVRINATVFEALSDILLADSKVVRASARSVSGGVVSLRY